MLRTYKEKSELAQSPEFKRIRQYLLEEILSVSNASIDPAELRGMLKLIRKADDWVQEYEIALKRYENKEI